MTSSPDALGEIRRVAVEHLLLKGAAPADAEDAAQNLLLKVHTNVQLSSRVDTWDQHVGYFCNAAYNEWLMMLRSEKARREREQTAGGSATASDVAQLTLFDLPGAAQLTNTQARYLEMLFYSEMSIREIAEWHGVSDRSVTGVVNRAYAVLRAAAETNDDSAA